MKKLKKIRLQHYMTQEELAKKAGVARNYISQLETGRRLPSISVAKALADALGVTWAELFEEEAE